MIMFLQSKREEANAKTKTRAGGEACDASLNAAVKR